MKILLHCCCGPCAIYPVTRLRAEGHELRAYFSNHIHPYSEWRRRVDCLESWAGEQALPLIVDDRYELVRFLEKAIFREERRCLFCYRDRLEKSVAVARKGKFEAFTTTLLYSRFQQHDRIRELGEELGRRYGVPFFYEDFRPGWQEGIRRSQELGLYRQQYCGCIYSEGERYLGRKKLFRHD